MSLKALAGELRGFGLGEACEKAEEMYEAGEASSADLFECFKNEYENRTGAKDLDVLSSAVLEVLDSGNEEVLDLAVWYELQKPGPGLEGLYSMMKELDVNDTKTYLLLSTQVFVIQNSLNVGAVYDLFARNKGDKKKLDEYFTIWKSTSDGVVDITHIKNALISGNFSFIGDRAVKIWDDTGFEDSFNLTNFTKMCNQLEIKIRMVSFLGHYHLVMRDWR